MNQTEPTNDDSTDDPRAEQTAAAPGAPDDDRLRLSALEAELGKVRDQLLRALADSENTRKRALREREDAGKYAVSAFARDLLDFSDNFRRALDAIPPELRDADDRIASLITGIESMRQELGNVFEKHGIKKIEPLHEPFNPNFHEVIFEAPGTGKPPGTIIQLIEPGYVIRDRLLRPARVGVAKDDGHKGEGHKIDTQA